MQKAAKQAIKRKRGKNGDGKLSPMERHQALEEKRKGGCATFWRKQQGGIMTKPIPAGPNTRKLLLQDIDTGPTWLDRYYTGTAKRKPLLNAEEYDAGMSLARAFKFKIYGIRWSYDQPTSSGGGAGDAEDTMATLEYSERLIRDFYAAVQSIEQKMVVQRVCMNDEAAGDKDRAATLKRGLAVLAKYWERAKPVCQANRRNEAARRKADYDKEKAEVQRKYKSSST